MKNSGSQEQQYCYKRYSLEAYRDALPNDHGASLSIVTGLHDGNFWVAFTARLRWKTDPKEDGCSSCESVDDGSGHWNRDFEWEDPDVGMFVLRENERPL